MLLGCPVLRQNSELKLLQILSASKQVVAGTLLKLRVLVAEGSNAAEYDVAVWEKPWESFRQVTEFKAAPGSSRLMSAQELEAANTGSLLADEGTAGSSGASSPILPGHGHSLLPAPRTVASCSLDCPELEAVP